jgi:valyl-tRNA synthetase
MELDKIYEPQKTEKQWADWWVSQQLYQANPNATGQMFSTVIPPPNVTGVLHMGHMLNHSEIDVVTRYRRMKGDNTLYLPGTDHAGIATQMVVERQLAAQGIDRRDLGRDEFEKRVWQWKEQSGGTIYSQMVRIGESCDWSRARFTMDEGLSKAVREVFVRLWEKGLIYRGPYMVNWDPVQGTAVSDLEVTHEEVNGHLWHIRYPVEGSDEHLIVATTRPETMLGDTAVAINAKDERYLHLHGKQIRVPLANRLVPIILDDMADPEFGTGCVKVTPAHDPNDFEAGKRHQLPQIQVIGFDAKMTAEAGEFAGLTRETARKAVVSKLEELGLLDRVEDHKLSVGKGQRSGAIVEPLISTQWFLSMKPLAEPAIKAVEEGRIKFTPETWTKTYYEWMHNIRDWCVSRQLWWGHRIPAWHCQDCKEVHVAREAVSACSKCGSANLQQDTDVLDTWFSSALWPFSTLGWPDKTADLSTYYPTTVLITGFDILFFWVARMVMMGIEFMGDVPFRDVVIHGLVRDADKQKMSKTKGNVIDPLEVTEKYGTDAIRLALLQGAAPGSDIAFSEPRMESARNFGNKIWNAARLIFMNMERSNVKPFVTGDVALQPIGGEDAALEDRWIFSRLNAAVDATNKALASYRYHDYAQTAWSFFWNEFCDWYLEVKKLKLQEGTGLTDDWRNLMHVFERSLRLLHPIMPFLTEELWSKLAAGATDLPKSISICKFPEFVSRSEDAEQQFSKLQEVVTAAREMRADFNLGTAEMEAELYVRELFEILAPQQAVMERIGRLKLQVIEGPAPDAAAVHATADFDLVMDVPADKLAARKTRLEKELVNLDKQIANHERQLGDPGFTSRAPTHILDQMRGKLEEYKSQAAKSRAALAR